MSKEAALRVMREAKYNARTAAAGAAPKAARPAARPAKARPTSTAPTAEQAEAVGALCGHKSMNGRTCTREQGHAAKSHRYS